MTTRAFWTAAAERATKTIAQAAIALIGTSALGILDVDWQAVASASALAGIVSLLTSVASSGVGGGGPSLANEVAVPAYLGDLEPVLIPEPGDDDLGDDTNPGEDEDAILF